MIGYFRQWQSDAIEPQTAHDFEAAFAVPKWPETRSWQSDLSVAVHASVAAAWQMAKLADGRCVLFTGTIFGRGALAEELETAADEQAVLYARARDRWGEQADKRINGTYAAVLFDDTRDRFEVVRSPIQAPPVYFAEFDGGVVVASLPRAIHATNMIEKRPDLQRFSDALVSNHKDQTRSWFEGIQMLPLGCRLLLSRQGPEIEKYYDLKNVAPVRLETDADYDRAMDDLLRHTVADVVEGANRPAISLSGGMDSQAIAYALAELDPNRKIIGLTHVPGKLWDGKNHRNRMSNEWGEVEKLAVLYPQIDASKIEIDGLSTEHRLTEFIEIGSLPPLVAFNMVWMHELYATAHDKGADVILDGYAGNHTFSFTGEPPYWYHLSRGRVGAFFSEVVATLRKPNGLKALAFHVLGGNFGDETFAWTIGKLRKLKVINPRNPFRISFILPSGSKTREAWRRFETINSVRAVGVVKSPDAHRKFALSTPSTDRDAIRQTLDLLHGTTSLSPLMHRSLVEFCLGLPPDQFYRFGLDRRIARRVLRGKVPDTVVDAKMRGLQSADMHARILQERPEMLKQIDRFELDPQLTDAIDLGRMREALENLPDERPKDSSSEIEAHLIATTINFGRFLRHALGRN